MKLTLDVDFESESNRSLEVEQDIFGGIYEDPRIKWPIFGLYILGWFGCGLLRFIVWFERSGEAGHFRTLVNQLNSNNLDLVIYVIIPIIY